MKSNKKKRVGVVVSVKTEKTAVVSIQLRYTHSKYLKTLVKTKRYIVHDEFNLSKEGDIVLIEEMCPISRHKTWFIKKIINISKK